MKANTSTILFLLGVFLWPGAQAHAQTWTRDAGSGYVNFGFSSISGDRFYGPDFESTAFQGGTEFRQFVLSAYGEVGVIDRWLTLSASAELLRENTLTGQGKTAGFGDTRLGFWSGLVTAPFRLTVGAWVGIPTGDPEPRAGASATAAEQQVALTLPTGDGEWDVTPTVRAGYSYGFGSVQQYIQGGLGFGVRTSTRANILDNDFANDIKYDFEFGTRFNKPVFERFWLILRLYGVESFASDEESANTAVGLGNGVTYTAYAVQLYGRVYKGLGANLSLESAFRARSIVAAPAVRFALSYEF